MDHPLAQSDTTAKNRFTSEEARAIDRLQMGMYNEIRQAAEAHRQTRQHIQSWVKPGMKMIDICEELEKTGRAIIAEQGLEAGLAFPTGCSRWIWHQPESLFCLNKDTIILSKSFIC